MGPAPLTQIQQQQLGLTQGAYVKEVRPGTPGEKAGFRIGDVIVRVGSTPIATYMDVRDTMYKYNPGDDVKVEVVRDGQHKTLDVKLGEPPKPPASMGGQMQNPFGGQDPMGGDSPFQFPNPNGRQGGRTPGQSHSGSAHLGAALGEITDEARSQYNLPSAAHGVLVEGIQPGSLAEKLQLKPGDVITQFGGASVTTPEALAKAIHDAKPGDSGSISFRRFTSSGALTQSRTFTFE